MSSAHLLGFGRANSPNDEEVHAVEEVTIEGFEPGLATEAQEIAEHFNSNHPDTVLFLARFAGGASEARQAEIAGLSPNALILEAQADGDSLCELKLPLDLEVTSLDQLRAGLMGLLVRSRKQAGDDVALTSIEREMASTSSLPTFITRVARTHQLTPNLLELTVAGGLDEFRPAGGDQFVYVMTPRPGQEHVICQGAQMAQLRVAPEEERPASAYYTIRRHRPEAGELDLWFVMHDHAGGVSGWAAKAEPGAPLALWGPRRAYEPPDETRELLLLGDETAFPAIASILEETELPAHVLVETVDESHRVPLPERAGVRIDWILRGEAPAHESAGLLEAVDATITEWKDGLYVFGAGETSRILAVRRALRRLGAPPSRVHLTAYWRNGRALND